MKGSLFLNKTYSENELKGLLEAILFVNGKPVSMDELKDILEKNSSDIEGLIEKMNQEYREQSRGLNIIPVAKGFQLVTNPAFKAELNELFGRKNNDQLSKSAMETLAIIAYKQPVSKTSVDQIRGVSSTRSINQLFSLKLIKTEHQEQNNEEIYYRTTDRFLELFGIQDLNDLPQIDEQSIEDWLSTQIEEDTEENEDSDNQLITESE